VSDYCEGEGRTTVHSGPHMTALARRDKLGSGSQPTVSQTGAFGWAREIAYRPVGTLTDGVHLSTPLPQVGLAEWGGFWAELVEIWPDEALSFSFPVSIFYFSFLSRI
jgi:hypothetical protein